MNVVKKIGIGLGLVGAFAAQEALAHGGRHGESTPSNGLGLVTGVDLGGADGAESVRAVEADATRAVRGEAFGMGPLAMPSELRAVRLGAGASWMVAPVELVSGDGGESQHVGAGLLAWEEGPWSAGLGQLTWRTNALIASETTAANIGWLRYRDDVRLSSHVRLEVDAFLRANLFQESVVATPLLRGIEDGIRACSSQSEIGLALRLVAAEVVTIEAFAIDQDDPFHFVSGAECFGDGAIWVQGSKAGLGIDLRLGKIATVGIDVSWARAEFGYDLEKRHGRKAFGTVEAENVAAGVTVAFAQ